MRGGAEKVCLFYLRSDIFAHVLKRAFFKAGNLRLADPDLGGNFHLRPAMEKTQFDNAPFTLAKLIQATLNGNPIQPKIIRTAFVTHLIHDVDRIAVIVIDRLQIREMGS